MATKKKKRTMTMAEAAHRILLKAGKKLHYRDIMAKAIKSGMVVTSGKTPEQSLRSIMATEFTRKGSRSRFRPKGDGYYVLTAYGRKTPPVDAARNANSKSRRKPARTGAAKRRSGSRNVSTTGKRCAVPKRRNPSCAAKKTRCGKSGRKKK